ncbi:hypothetical protein LSCM1_00157 [Leishmania martiniquensis]|uniref:B box-type domain-containing protein n=1 Tax=Leishmania martiniquensis TaxID=1580590 RepID=A0A836FY95_9TRYP|nr:hypothetical protein LSCM1_00157 [Leishmania martiniquensis]
MAKHTVEKPTVKGVRGSETGATNAPISRSAVEEIEALHLSRAVALPFGEEANPTKVSPEETTGTPLSWPYLCPLCSAVELVDPVELHAPVRDTLSPSAPHSEPVDESFHCLACRVCAEHWLSAVHAFNENRTATAERTSDTGDSAAAATCSPLSLAAPDCVSLVACPLCKVVCDAGTLSSLDSVDAVARILDAHVVRNVYTGSQIPLPTMKVRSTVDPASAPTASASPLCSVCEEVRTTCVCVQCDFGMCDACHKATHTKGGFKQHEVMDLEQARRRGHLRCTQHAGMALDLFCDTCSTCVCVTCCFGGAHRGHDVSPLADVVARTAAALTQRSAELAALQRDAETTHMRFTSLWPAYQTKIDGVRAEIQQCFASLRQVLQDREDTLLARLDEVSAEVGRRSSELKRATRAVSSLLRGAGESMRRLPALVSPAMLMRLIDTAQQQQEWVSRVSTRVLEEAAAFADGWSYHLCTAGANGCRMASFVLLNAATPNDDGVREYKRVLADLGRLNASADVQLRLAEKQGAASLETVERREERMSGGDEHPCWGGIAVDYTAAGDDLKDEALVDCGSGSYPTSDIATHAEERKEEELVRPSHIATATLSLPLQAASSTSRKASLACRDMELCAEGQRSMTASTVLSQSRPPPLSSRRAPDSLPPAPLRARELNLHSPMAETGLVASSAASYAAGAASQLGITSRWSDARQEEQVVSDRGSFTTNLGPLGCRAPEDAAAAAQGMRETMPYRVSLPPRRVGSHSRADESGRTAREDDDPLPWRAFKLHRNSSARDDFRSSATPPARHGSTTRLHYLTEWDLQKPGEMVLAAYDTSFSALRQDRAESQRRATGLQLEL